MARTLYKEHDRFVETYWDRYGKDTYLVGDAARRRRGRLLLDRRPDRRRDQRLRPPALDDGGRVGAGLHTRGRRGRRDRRARRGHGPGDRRLRHPGGRREGRRRAWRPSCASTSPTRSASSRARSRSSSPTTCRRPARARSCAACCATSPPGNELGDVTTLRDPDVVEDAPGAGGGLEGRLGAATSARSHYGTLRDGTLRLRFAPPGDAEAPSVKPWPSRPKAQLKRAR